MRPYRLSCRAYVCVANEGAVFLDLKQDAYLGIDRHQADALAAMVEDWPPTSSAVEISTDPAHQLLAEDLCARGLLVHATSAHRLTRIPALPIVRSELIAWDQMISARTRGSHVLVFLCAFAWAWLSLRLLTLDAIVRRHQRRDRRHDGFELERAKVLVSVYHNIRIWVFARKGRCMLDSLAMLEFLSCYGVRPFWVIGVQMKPFAAHSWLQYGECVLNGTPVFVRAYTPILVV